MRASQKRLKQQLDYARYTHLAIMYVIALLIFLFSHFPHKWWILLTVLLISAAIEPGLMTMRIVARVRGTLLALALLIPLIYALQINYRFIPILFVISALGMITASMNPSRADIGVFFATMSIFLMDAQSEPPTTREGPIEMVLNRGICTLLGVTIVMTTDKFFFYYYKYAQKLYLLNQMITWDFLQKQADMLRNTPVDEINRYVFMENMRDKFNDIYTNITTSADSLCAIYEKDMEMIQQVNQFQQTIWDVRKILFSLTASLIILKEEHISQEYLAEYQLLMQKAKGQFIRTR